MLPLITFVPFSKLQPAGKTSPTLPLSDPGALLSTLALHQQCNTVPAISAFSDPRQPLGRKHGQLRQIDSLHRCRALEALKLWPSFQQTGHGKWRSGRTSQVKLKTCHVALCVADPNHRKALECPPPPQLRCTVHDFVQQGLAGFAGKILAFDKMFCTPLFARRCLSERFRFGAAVSSGSSITCCL